MQLLKLGSNHTETRGHTDDLKVSGDNSDRMLLCVADGLF